MGRPGWHIECTAIAQEFLGNSIEIQGGGSDLIFPHHEMGSAQAECISGKEFARAYVHTGMIGLDGEKMSKSRGNLVFVSDLRGKHDPNAIRLALLMGHYRSNRDWSNDLLNQAANKLTFWRSTLAHSIGSDSTSTIAKVIESLSSDLDTPAAIAHIDDWMREQKGTGDVSGPGKITRAIDALLGLAL
jgi:L-cysteine:1D-myo-inositol 2-amino-2-deoxy-alpha-D-glucopyranoside ligase